MPIKPENRARYPANWKAIRAQILERAGYRCEGHRCGARQYSVGWWAHGGASGWRWIPVWGQDDYERTYREARQAAAEIDHEKGEEGPKPVVVVLTVAHLDHMPENCDPENLRALCQRCHLAHDHAHHMRNAAATRKKGKAGGDLLDEIARGAP